MNTPNLPQITWWQTVGLCAGLSNLLLTFGIIYSFCFESRKCAKQRKQLKLKLSKLKEVHIDSAWLFHRQLTLLHFTEHTTLAKHGRQEGLGILRRQRARGSMSSLFSSLDLTWGATDRP